MRLRKEDPTHEREIYTKHKDQPKNEKARKAHVVKVQAMLDAIHEDAEEAMREAELAVCRRTQAHY